MKLAAIKCCIIFLFQGNLIEMRFFLLFVLLIGSTLARNKPNNNKRPPTDPNDDSSDDSSDDSNETATCDEGASCGICGTSTSYIESISGDARVITGNGCPNHYSVCTGKALANGCGGVGEEGSITEATEQCFDYTIPAYPVLRTDTYSVA